MSTSSDAAALEGAEDGIPLEEAPASSATTEKPRDRRKLWILGITVIVLLAIVGVTVGLVVSSKRNEGNSDSVTPPPENTGNTDGGGTNATDDGSAGNSTTTTTPPPDGEDSTTTTPPPDGENSTTTPPPEDPISDEETFYQSTSGVFNVTLPLFSSNVARGYADETQLVLDLTEACKFKVNRIVEQGDYYHYGPVTEDTDFADESASEPSVGAPSSPSAEGVDHFETNNQEEDVDEGDLLKTNGVHAFVAYGDKVIVWEVETGRYITNITLPPISSSSYGKPPPGGGVPVDEGFGGRRKLQEPIGVPYYNPRPNVQSLLLHEDKLVVVANGYGQTVWSELDYYPVFYEAYGTNIRVYDISELSTTEEVVFDKETHIHGYYNSARAIGSIVHLVTFSGINTYPYLDEPLARWQPYFQDLNDNEYRLAARRLAEDELIPNFVGALIRDLSSHGELANLARVTLWQLGLSNDTKLEDTVFSAGVINSYGQVTSFDMLDSSEELDVAVSVSGVLMPTGWGHTYANKEMLVIAGQGWDWVGSVGGSVQTTYLHGFALKDDSTTEPSAVGQLRGSLINQYAVDVVGEYMRVATTIRNDMWVFVDVEDDVVDEFAVARQQPVPMTENYVIVLKIPEFDGSSPGVLEEVGRTDSLGKEGEVFTGVRFADKVAYVVTFRQTDPFYVIRFDDTETPVVLGELSITGFSRYLHFVNEANTLLLGVGQEANDQGMTLGLQVSLYDSTDPTNPDVIDRYPVELEEGVYSYSEVEWDFKAFRYVPLGDDYGILILPVRIDSYTSTEGNFDGFILLDIDTNTGITERFRISHVDSENFRLGCYYWAKLPQRSFVVNGNVTTCKGHSIRIHDLDSGLPTGGIDIDDGIEQDDGICYYW